MKCKHCGGTLHQGKEQKTKIHQICEEQEIFAATLQAILAHLAWHMPIYKDTVYPNKIINLKIKLRKIAGRHHRFTDNIDP